MWLPAPPRKLSSIIAYFKYITLYGYWLVCFFNVFSSPFPLSFFLSFSFLFQCIGLETTLIFFPNEAWLIMLHMHKLCKWNQIMWSLHKITASLILLQETQFKTAQIPSCYSFFYLMWFHSVTAEFKSRDVSIAICKDFLYVLLDHRSDAEGRCLFPKITLFQKLLVLANVSKMQSESNYIYRNLLKQIDSIAPWTRTLRSFSHIHLVDV